MKVIAEIGWNFVGDIDLCEKMICAAKESGADIAKFQYWDPSTIKDGPWMHDGRIEIYKKAALDDKKISFILDACKKNKIKPLFSVFNSAGAEYIHSKVQSVIKIPSHEIANYDLIDFCSSNFDFIFLSAGACLESELKKSLSIINKNDCEFNLMHCISSYPCEIENMNLGRINKLLELHNQVGLSDHSQSLITGALAVSMGATVIEKHFTIDKDLPGRDNKFALDLGEMSEYIINIKHASEASKYHGFDLLECEKDTFLNYRGRWG